MTDHITAEWRDFTFQMVTTADMDKVAKHVREHFLKCELMNKQLGWSDENSEDHDQLVFRVLSHGLSFVVVKNDTQEVAAINLIKGQTSKCESNKFSPKSQNCKTIFRVISKLEEISSQAFHQNFDAYNYAEICITSVAKKFEGQGIASEMYRRTLEFLKAKHYKSVKSGFSSPGTRTIGAKLGFCEIGRTYLNTYINENGDKTFPNACEDDFIQEAAKLL